MENATNRNGLLSRLSQWVGGGPNAAPGQQRDTSVPLTEEEARTWLRSVLATRLKLPLEQVDCSKTFEEYGLDSRTAVGVSGELEEWLGQSISPTLLWDCPSIDAVARNLVKD